MKRNTVNGQGYDLHDKPADLFFRHAAETVKKRKIRQRQEHIFTVSSVILL